MLPQNLSRLILTLRSREETCEIRDDAAMDLGDYDQPEAEQVLIEVGSDAATDPTVAASCGESLAQIWLRQQRIPEGNVLEHLRPEALSEVQRIMRKPSGKANAESRKR